VKHKRAASRGSTPKRRSSDDDEVYDPAERNLNELMADINDEERQGHKSDGQIVRSVIKADVADRAAYREIMLNSEDPSFELTSGDEKSDDENPLPLTVVKPENHDPGLTTIHSTKLHPCVPGSTKKDLMAAFSDACFSGGENNLS
jgi:hypothetical protein